MFRSYIILITLIYIHNPHIIHAHFKWDKALSNSSINNQDSFIDSLYQKVEKAKEIILESKNLLQKSDAHYFLGKVYYNQAVYGEALDNLLQAEAIFKELNHESLGDVLNTLEELYYDLKQPDKAFQYHELALKHFERLRDNAGVARSLGLIGRMCEKQGDLDKALEIQKQALELIKDSDEIIQAKILENIGSIYEDLEDFEKAEEYYRLSQNYAIQAQDSVLLTIIYNNLGDIYRKRGNFSKGLYYTELALELGKKSRNMYQIISAYKDLGKTYQMMGEFEKAYACLDTGRRMYEEVYQKENQERLAIIQSLFELEQKENQIDLLKKSAEADRYVKISLALLLTLLLVTGIFIIRNQKLKIKAEKKLLEKQSKIHQAEKKLLESELENTQLKQQNLINELESKTKALSAYALHIISKNQILEDLRKKLNDVYENEGKEQKKMIKRLIKQIEINFVQDKDWDHFIKIFEQVHQDFFDKLSKVNNELSPAEIRLAALIKMNMNSKDIATLLGISSDSLRIARYRLKKKLNLKKEQSLAQFILSF